MAKGQNAGIMGSAVGSSPTMHDLLKGAMMSKIPEMTLDRADELWKKTGYAYDAIVTQETPLNEGDAAAFFLEGYEYARKLMESTNESNS